LRPYKSGATFSKKGKRANLLQLLSHPESSEWFSEISVFVFEVNIAAEQKKV